MWYCLPRLCSGYIWNCRLFFMRSVWNIPLLSRMVKKWLFQIASSALCVRLEKRKKRCNSPICPCTIVGFSSAWPQCLWQAGSPSSQCGAEPLDRSAPLLFVEPYSLYFILLDCHNDILEHQMIDDAIEKHPIKPFQPLGAGRSFDHENNLEPGIFNHLPN